MEAIENTCDAPSDDRRSALLDGLNQLPDGGLVALRDHLRAGESVVLDEVHYDAKTGLWCPLAVGLGVPGVVERSGISKEAISEQKARDIILSVGREACDGFSLNPLSHVRGQFFTRNRAVDLRTVVDQMLETAR